MAQNKFMENYILDAPWGGETAIVIGDYGVNVLTPQPNRLAHLSYRGWLLWWTGWKPNKDVSCFFAQWVASKGGLRKYAAYPGGQGGYVPGTAFDTWVREGQRPVEFDTQEKEIDQARASTLQRLLDTIDQYENFGAEDGTE